MKSVTINATVSPEGIYTFNWMDAGNNVISTLEDLVTSKPGTYTLNVTGTNGCTATETVIVTQDISVPTVTIAEPADLNCTVTSVTINATVTSEGTYTFSWMDAGNKVISTSEDLVTSKPGTYTLNVTGTNGCTATETVIVTQDLSVPIVTIAEPGDLNCTVTSVTINATVTSEGTYTFSWMDAGNKVISTSEDLVTSKPGTYTLNVTGTNGCTATENVIVTQDISAPTVEIATSGTLNCTMTSVTINATVTSEGTYTYRWTDEENSIISTSEDLVTSKPGTYTLNVTGTNGCTATETVIVTQDLSVPTVTIAAFGTLNCTVTSVTINATVTSEGTYTFSWMDSGNKVISTSEDLVTSKPGTYTLNVTGTNGCTATETVIVTQDLSVPTVTIAEPGDLNCTVKSVTINATVSPEGIYTFNWMDAGNNVISTSEDLVTSKPGTYTLNVTGTNGCTATENVIVTQDLSVPTVTIAEPGDLNCTVTSVTINATVTSEGTYTFSWMDAGNKVISTSEDLVTSKPGTYTLNVTGTNGCTATETVIVTQDLSVPTVTITAFGTLNCTVTSVTINATVTSEGTYTFSWMDSGNKVISTSEDLVTSKPGTYTLNVTGTNGCTATENVIVTQDISAPTVEIATSGTLNCTVKSVTINATVSPEGIYTFNWMDAGNNVISTSEDLVTSKPGTYILNVTGTNGCTATETVIVTQDLSVPIVTIAAPGTLNCTMTSVTINATVTSEGTYTFSWMDSGNKVISTSEDLVTSKPGTYTLNVTGTNGCTATENVIVTQDISAPTVEIATSGALNCTVKSVTINATVSPEGIYTFNWMDAGNNVISTLEDLVTSKTGNLYSECDRHQWLYSYRNRHSNPGSLSSNRDDC